MDYYDIPILYAAARCGIPVDAGTDRVEVEANCPFCNDRKKHMSLNTANNQFCCHRCGESGNSLLLYAKVCRIDNKKAFKELMIDLSRGVSGYGNQYRAAPAQILKGTEPTKLKPLENRHDVYYDMLALMDLSPAHRRNLLNRGLDNSVIERNMYRTVPESGTRRYYDLIRSLAGSHDLEGIPGFYRKGGKWHMAVKQGLFIPVCTRLGYIQGFQIRLDSAENRKYRWFSSKNYDRGVGAETYIHVANWNNSGMVYVTEGALKAEVSSFLMGGACVVGIPGVNCVGGLTGLLREMGVREIIEAFDMDKLTNQYVSAALRVLKEKVVQAGIKYRSAKWNPDFKGLDDFYLALNQRQAA